MHYLSFDIEEHWRSYEARGIPFNPEHALDVATTEWVLEQLETTGTKATFFVISQFAEKEPALIRHIVAAGHELGSHSHAHLIVPHHSRASFREDARRSRKVLEQIGQTNVISFRAPQYSISAACPWALRELAEAGYQNDSSIFPGHLHRHGWPAFPARPVTLTWPDGLRLREFPGSGVGLNMWTTQYYGGFYWRVLPGCVRLMKRPRDYAMWYFHPFDLSPDYAVPEKSPLQVRLMKKAGTRSAQQRFTKLLGKCTFAGTLRDAPALADIFEMGLDDSQGETSR